MTRIAAAEWLVLLIGGPCGVGKTTVAAQVAARLGAAWLMVDDLRLALARSGPLNPQPVRASSAPAAPAAARPRRARRLAAGAARGAGAAARAGRVARRWRRR